MTIKTFTTTCFLLSKGGAVVLDETAQTQTVHQCPPPSSTVVLESDAAVQVYDGSALARAFGDLDQLLDADLDDIDIAPEVLAAARVAVSDMDSRSGEGAASWARRLAMQATKES